MTSQSIKHEARSPAHRRVRSASRTPAMCLAGALCLGITPAVGAPDPGIGCFFAEPLTGRRVNSYTVELATDRDQRSSFDVPQDCREVIQAMESNQAYTGSVIDRGLWQKVESDCRYHAFLNYHPLDDMQDYVSDYDFMNANLNDLPIDQRCAHDGSVSKTEDCNPAATDPFGLLRTFPITEPPDHTTDFHEREACELQDGLFRGRLYVDAEGVHCDPGAGAPSLRLVAVDFADVNGDRVLDAVLRFIPIGPGASRMPLTLPVTRFSETEPFSAPVFEAPPPLRRQ
jgi:hypothetical protein